MSRKSLLLGFVALGLAVAFGIYFLTRTRPVTVAELQGEWVQDPDYLQNAGADLDAQKREVDEWENYQFAFHGTHLTGWRLVFDSASRDGLGWAQGKGVSFESDYTLAKVKGATKLTFIDYSKAARDAQLVWEQDKLFVHLGDRALRLIRRPADQLRVRNLIAVP
jgi:hypothetical protein